MPKPRQKKTITLFDENIDLPGKQKKSEWTKARDARVKEYFKTGVQVPTYDYTKVETVMAPTFLSLDQQRVWYELMDLFLQCGVITLADLPALNVVSIAYCAIVYPHPDDKFSVASINTVVRMLGKFGCVPNDRKVQSRRQVGDQLDMLHAMRE